jgi:Flp pilus assembly protein TadD
LLENSQVASAIPSESQAGASRRRAIRFLIAAVVVSGSAAAVAWWQSPRSSRPRRAVHPLDATSPYANTRPGVGYVGDAACIRCHAEIAETYRQHPMGRSLSSIDAAKATIGDEVDGRVLFEADGLEYAIERRDGHVFHQETRRDASGRVIARNEAEVRFALGSGSQGVSFLIDRDGFLFESPIGWYSRKRRWDLSPGYRRNNAHFDRPVLPGCLYCHANRVEPVEGTMNRYRPPIFRGQSIGCERCHGPGELHVKRPGLVDGRDTTIVNPAALEPSRRDAVCEQCHLMGQQRVVKLDRQDDDFRPGLPFYSVWSVFERAAGTDEDRFVGQVEQMHESRCFRDSGGRLGCISCHDPHRRPSPEERASYFRERCLECHADRGCRLPEATRRARVRGDDCTGCHMPRSESSDVAHVAVTNHRIPRRADARAQSPTGTGAPSSGERPLVLFHRDLMDEHQRVEAERDLGVALSKIGPEAASMALPLLDAALSSRPDDLVARQAKGTVLGRLGRFEDGLAAFRTALAQDQDQELVRMGAVDLAARAGRRQDAIADLRRVIAINPWRAAYRMDLAALYFDQREWPDAASACREALRLNPADVETRKLLVRCYLHLESLEAARAEFEALLGFDPPDREELIRRFAILSRPR